MQMATQWRMGFGGPIGLDYGVLPFVMRMASVPPTERSDVFMAVQLMERAAMEEMSEKRHE